MEFLVVEWPPVGQDLQYCTCLDIEAGKVRMIFGVVVRSWITVCYY